MENGSGALVRQEHFGGHQLATVQETSSVAVAAQAKASIEARWIVALRAPRDMEDVRASLLRECQRPSFAEVAKYHLPIGDGVSGLSIRYVEQALQAMGNVDTQAITIYDDNEKRIVEVSVTDYQRNVCHRKQITVKKTVERRYLKKDQKSLGSRRNSYGDLVHIVEATDDEILNKEAALVSKAVRTCGLRLIPGWLQEESERAIDATKHSRAAKDPDAEARKIVDAFSALNVTPGDLKQYLGHEVGKCSPAQLVTLREIYAAIRDGETSWAAVMDNAKEAPAEDDKKPNVGAQAVKDKLAQKTPKVTERLGEKAKAVKKKKAAKKKADQQAPSPPTEEEQAAILAQERAEAEAQEAQDPEEPAHDPNTGEVFDDEDLPDWMREGSS